jgi:hypothetical protein
MILDIRIESEDLSENDLFCLRESIRDYDGGCDLTLTELLEDLPGLKNWQVYQVDEVQP